MENEKFEKFEVCKSHFGSLSIEMYNLARALIELVRNAMVACMASPDVWNTLLVHIELSLLANFQHLFEPSSPKDGTALLIFDRGHGFRDKDKADFKKLGKDMLSKNVHHGAEQKGIGRFAALVLNTLYSEAKAQWSGFYVLSRCTTEGPVTFIKVVIDSGGVSYSTVAPDDPRLGPYKNVKGTFSLIVIPNSAFKTEDEIRNALAPFVSQRKDKQMDIRVGGKLVEAPPLPIKNVSVGPIDAYLEFVDKTDKANRDRGGIVLCDRQTGLPCAKASEGDVAQNIEYPLNRTDIEGVIFCDGLLSNQNTDRRSLKLDFLQSEDWERINALLRLKVVPFAKKEILGDHDELSTDGDKLDHTMNDLIKGFHKRWGTPKNYQEVTKSPPPPTTQTTPPTLVFTASPNNIRPGEQTTLIWSAKDAQSVTLNGRSVSNTDTKVVTPAKTTNYVLRAVFSKGNVEEKTVTVAVTATPPVKTTCGTHVHTRHDPPNIVVASLPSINIEDRCYYISKIVFNDPLCLAEVVPVKTGEPDMLLKLNRSYAAMPISKSASAEHVLLRIFEAIATRRIEAKEISDASIEITRLWCLFHNRKTI